jgi:ParB-like chromosome segregation protein Spo0J
MKQIEIKKVKIELSKLVTMAEMGLGAERPLNKEKRTWISKLKKDGAWDPILVTPIKDSGYYLLTDGWHRVQAAKGLKRKTINALQLPANVGLSMAKANKILRDIDREHGFRLHCSDIIGHWAMMQSMLQD